MVDPGTAFSLVGLLYLLLSIAAGMHVLLNKQNEAAAFSWLGIIVLAPLVGAALYWLFGINRIRRRARAELPEQTRESGVQDNLSLPVGAEALPAGLQHLMRTGSAIHPSPYLPHNCLDVLRNSDEAYPAMLEAIRDAKESVVLSSYIFEYDSIGREFVDALVFAHNSGVEVRVLIDGLGVGYGFSLVRSDRVLRKQGVRTARFLSALSTSGTRFINLRNHRKILSVDGRVAFVGGINIRAGNLLDRASKEPTQDVHFRIKGEVIDQINKAFVDDWAFATGEKLELPGAVKGESQRRDDPSGLGDTNVICRVLLDGPDDNYQKLKLTMLGAINAATTRIRIASPYFLPDQTIQKALYLAVLRGVSVDVCVPSKNNLRLVGWAMRANTKRLLSYGVQLHESQPPFDHSKIFLVDHDWALIGSSNWDERSLELNFEINLECYGSAFNLRLNQLMDRKLGQSTRVSNLRKEPLLLRLRNNFCRLLSPYL